MDGCRSQADDQVLEEEVVVVVVEVVAVVVLIVSHFSLTILFTASFDNLKFFFSNAQH